MRKLALKIRVCQETIKQLRLDKGWSQEKLAEKTGVHSRTIQRIENQGVASMQTLASLASALAVQASVLRKPEPTQAVISKGLAHSHCGAQGHKQTWESFQQRQQVHELAKQVENPGQCVSYHWIGWAILAMGGILLVEVLLMTQANLSRTVLFNVLFPGISIGLLLMLAGQLIVTLSTKAANKQRALSIFLVKEPGKAESQFHFRRYYGNVINAAGKRRFCN